jgi:type II secretory ATPase GspE/PulE/Tfp pilus assembly ATPase PilB-like protein
MANGVPPTLGNIGSPVRAPGQADDDAPPGVGMTPEVELSSAGRDAGSGGLGTSTIESAAAAEVELRERCKRLSIEWFEEVPEDVEAESAEAIDADDAVRLRAIPIHINDESLTIVMRDPLDLAAADEVSVLSGRPVERCGMAADAFKTLLTSQYGTTAARMAERLGGEEEGEDLLDSSNIEAIDAEDLHRMAEQPTLINLVNLIVLEAIRDRASDVHVEPFESELRIKYRVDGVLQDRPYPPKQLQPAIVSRIKIMAGMNIAERFVPQDGHIALRFEGRKVDIRVSTVPTLYGESVVLRILDKSTLPLELPELGMSPRDIETVDKLIATPHGLVLVTGPTGSGKTTTLYAALQKLYTPEKKIITIEDPVEYELPGVNQIHVNPKRGLMFATGLRHILRQDPDVIMVGEIRDGETAEIAVRSALTGHLVFSTVHTNDAVSAITRLIDMGVEPFLLASVLEGSQAQRLGRRVCQYCRHEIAIPEAVSHRLSEAELAMFNGKCWTGDGCDKCNQTGYRGRVGFFEVMRVTGPMRQAISSRKGTRDILACAGPEHMSMRSDGVEKASHGVTTIEEVLRATQDAEDFA